MLYRCYKHLEAKKHGVFVQIFPSWPMKITFSDYKVPFTLAIVSRYLLQICQRRCTTVAKKISFICCDIIACFIYILYYQCHVPANYLNHLNKDLYQIYEWMLFAKKTRNDLIYCLLHKTKIK